MLFSTRDFQAEIPALLQGTSCATKEERLKGDLVIWSGYFGISYSVYAIFLDDAVEDFVGV